MTDQTVMSLAGEEVAVFDDADFGELAGFDPTSRSFRHSFALRPSTLAVLKALWRHGTINDRSGLAVGRLAERVRTTDGLEPVSMNAVLTTPLMKQAVERVTSGRRTMQVSLVALPRTWLAKVEGALGEHPAEPDVLRQLQDIQQRNRAVVEQRQLWPAAVPEPAPGVEMMQHAIAANEQARPEPAVGTDAHMEVADAVATALMARVVEIISNNGTNVLAVKNAQLTGEIAQLQKRLGEQVGFVDRLRRDLREAQDEVIATKHERDGLRQRLQSAEHNLKVATGADAQRIIDAEVRRAVDQMMRQAPGSQHGAA